jgi:hypothetical protein
MWYPPFLFTTVGVTAMFGVDIVIKTIGLSMSGLGYLLSLTNNSNRQTIIDEYTTQLDLLDIDLKLNLAKNWLEKIKSTEIMSPLTDIMYKNIVESSDNISQIIQTITEKINLHNNKWFYSWRTLDLSDDIKQLKKHATILGDRLRLINIG